MTGSSGLVGSALVSRLDACGHEVRRLVRGDGPAGEGQVSWNPVKGTIDEAGLEYLDAVVHLAGENIASGRWTAAKKKKIRDSRVEGTRLLSEALARLEEPPGVLLSASAVGYYGNRGEESLTEECSPGRGFLAEVCQEWEGATRSAEEAGVRVVHLRLGAVLSPIGGALERMLKPFQMGAGGKIGKGTQYMSWITIDDAVDAVQHSLLCEDLEGPVNVVAPSAVTNREFTKTLGRVLSRPTPMSMPAFAARLAFGELADEILLASAKVVPKRLVESGYQFRSPELEGALRHLLGK